jgi:uncharacterized protein
VNAVDTNILVYAHRKEAPHHKEAAAVLQSHCEGSESWAIPWPCISEFYSVVTNPKIWKDKASRPADALKQIESWCKSPSVLLLGEVAASLDQLSDIIRDSQVRGPVVHDARIVALCLAHGVRVLLTADRDFSRFPQMRYECPWKG